MKITTKIAGLLLLLICGLAHAEWVVYGKDKDGRVLSFDPARVTNLNDSALYHRAVKVWYKETGSAQLKIADIEKMARESDNNTAAGRETAMLFREKIPIYKNYSHTLHLAHIDCSRQTHWPKEWVAYSTDGSVLERFKVNPTLYSEEIYPGTLMEVLMITVCKKR